jgi:DNA-binding GntR family transcriptional regulator
MGPKSRFADGAHEHAAQFVRDGIRQGRWQPGEALEATAIAAELGMSASPVREALARLRGERLLDTRHRNGYSIPLLQSHELESEYRFMSLLAISLAGRPPVSPTYRRSSTMPYGERVDGLLTALARAVDMPVGASTLHRSTLRLFPYVRAEPLLVADAEPGLAEMERLLDLGDAAALMATLQAHFDRCIAVAPRLARHVHERTKSFGKEFE